MILLGTFGSAGGTAPGRRVEEAGHMAEEKTRQEYERKRRGLITALIVAVVLLFAGSSAIGQIFGDRWGMITLLVVIIGFLLFVWKYWRCPSCGKHLGPELSHRRCPHCGVRLMG